MSDIILSEPVLEELVKTLTLIDLDNFRQANNLEELPVIINVQDVDDQIAQINYLDEGIIDLIEQLEKYGSKHLLNWAILETNFPLVELLIQLGADPNGKVSVWVLPEDLRRRYGNLAYRPDYQLMFPLLAAIEVKDPKIIEYLLKHGADPNPEINKGILKFAIATDDLEIVETLLKYGSDPNVIEIYTGSLLNQAVNIHTKFDLARLLVRYGANLNKVNFDSQSILDATDINNEDKANLMLEFGYTPGQIEARRQEMIEEKERANYAKQKFEKLREKEPRIVNILEQQGFDTIMVILEHGDKEMFRKIGLTDQDRAQIMNTIEQMIQEDLPDPSYRWGDKVLSNLIKELSENPDNADEIMKRLTDWQDWKNARKYEWFTKRY